MNIGILGSACDPPHNGHREIGEAARKKIGLDKIFLIPSHMPPHKNVPEASVESRLSMARLFVKNLPDWKVYDGEIRRGGVSYTKDTLYELKKQYPNDTLFMIIGLDNLVHMPDQWKEGYAILDESSCIVAVRSGYSAEEVPSHILEKIILLELEDSPFRALSSTMIRALCKEHASIDAYVSAHVAAYMHEKKIYENTI